MKGGREGGRRRGGDVSMGFWRDPERTTDN